MSQYYFAFQYPPTAVIYWFVSFGRYRLILLLCSSNEPPSSFHIFSSMTEALYGFKVKAFPMMLAKLLAEEFCKPHSTVRDFNNTRMSITLVRATNRCIRGSRIPVSHMSIRFRLEEGTGLGLMRVRIGSRLWMSGNICRSEQNFKYHRLSGMT